MRSFLANKYGKGQQLLLLAFLLLHTIVAAICTANRDLTIDEPDYYVYGVRWAHGQVERVNKMDDSKSPFTVLSVIPRSIVQLFNPSHKAHDFGVTDMKMGRYMLVFYTFIIAIYLFLWCRRLFGEKAWILPVLFFLFDPMVLTYSMIIITDMATGACVIATCYHLFRFYQTKQVKQYSYFAIWLALACVVKASIIFLVPCFLLLWLVLLLTKQATFKLKPALTAIGINVLMFVLIINLLYQCKQTFIPIGQQKVNSAAFQGLLEKWPFIKSIPFPFPATYFESLDMLQLHKEIGGGTANSTYMGVYLHGEMRLRDGFWYYYLVTGWYKIPIATLLLFFISIVSGIMHFNWKKFLQQQVWYIWPALFLFIVLSVMNPFQIGFRHVLSIYPLFFVGVAGCITYWQQRNIKLKYVAVVLFAGMLISSAIYFPQLLPYTNEFIRDKKMVYTTMNDANIDYGQVRSKVKTFIQQHPEYSLPTIIPSAGKFIVPVNKLLPNADPSPAAVSYPWLQPFTPAAHYEYALLLYNITEEDLHRAGY